MKYSLHVDIDLPRDAVIDCFNDPHNLPKWQSDLLELEPVEGIPGQPGSKTRLVYRTGSREMEMIETVTERTLPDRIAFTYSAKGMVNHMVHRFEDLGDRTRWHTDNEFIGQGWYRLLTWITPFAFKNQTRKMMRQFKAFAETGEPQH